MEQKRLILLIVVLIVSSFSAGVFLKKTNVSTKESSPTSFEKLTLDYPYLSKRIQQEDQNDYLINFLSLRRQLRQTIEPFQDNFAFYFEYLPTGSSIGINDKAEFSAASLIKVPIVMAYYHYKERVGQAEDETVTIKPEQIDKGDGDLWQKGPGTEINMAEAVKLALIDSDNTAALVLAANIPQEDFDAVYAGLDIDFVQQDNEVIITAKHYSSILKALYFSSVLSKKSSNYILELLTSDTPRDKINLGIPSEVKVANKTGLLAQALYQDCGIVYPPKRPYLLCLISQSNENVAIDRMKEISEMVYNYVKNANTNQ